MKLLISHTTKPRIGQTFAFEEAPFVTLGSKPDNDFVFDEPSDKEVSGRHIQIRQEGQALVIQDLGSQWGTRVNGQLITKTELQQNDLVTLGKNGPSFAVGFVLDVQSTQASATTQPPDGDKTVYGQTTVGMMIQQVLRSAGALRTGMFRSTAYFEALLERRLRISTRRYRLLLMIGLPALVLSLVVLTVVLLNRPPAPSPSNADPGPAIAHRFAPSIYLMAGLPKNSQNPNDYVGFCTAFAIGHQRMVTNAHCVSLANVDYHHLLLLQNNSHRQLHIKQMLTHPAYHPNDQASVDLGLLITAETAPQVTQVAKTPNVTTGEPIYMFGFPGLLNDLANPVATFTRGEVGRVTSLDGTKDGTLIQHSAITVEGTSGSPLFNAAAEVVAVNAGGYVDQNATRPGYNFAIRVDQLAPLLSKADTLSP